MEQAQQRQQCLNINASDAVFYKNYRLLKFQVVMSGFQPGSKNSPKTVVYALHPKGKRLAMARPQYSHQ